MTLTLTQHHADQIDCEIWQIYKGRLGGRELEQLAKLFHERHGLPARLATVLKPTLRAPGPFYREELQIDLAWIDKHPVAKLAKLGRRVELGDAAIFFFDVMQHKGTIKRQEARAIILQ